MNWISSYIIAILAAWIIASGVKVVILLIKGKKLSGRPIIKTGGMPSVHTAPAVALTTVIALTDGINSAIFAVALFFSIIVMIDAIHVRRAVGEQGEFIKRNLQKGEKLPYLAKGHTPVQMIVGAAIGLVVGLCTFYFL